MATITFELFAPYNASVSLKGDFTHWEPVPLEKDERGYWRLERDLDDGRYEYLYEVASRSWFFEEDEIRHVTDPYASEVVDDADQHAVLHVKDGQKVICDYQWQNDDAPLPQNHELIIYELLTHDFHVPADGGDSDQRGTFQTIREKADYLADLGVTAIELLPIEEYPGRDGWGYNPRHFFAVESSYGTPADFMQLVDDFHGRGMRVFKDGVYNHSETSSPLTQIDHDYWFHHDPQDSEQNWGPEFNYEFHDGELDVMPACQFVGDVVGHWISQYHLDGIRFDAVAQMNNFMVLDWLDTKGYEISGQRPFTTIAEYMPPTPDVTKPNGPVDACWNVNFHYAMKEMLTGESIDVEKIMDCVDARRHGFENTLQVVNYLASHDHNHLMADLGHAGLFDEAAFRRARLGAIVLFTAIGTPMIWQGQEFGNATECLQEPTPVDWSLLDNENGAALHGLYKSLIHLRRTNTALHGTDLEFVHVHDSLPIVAFIRWNGEGARVLTVLNFSDSFIEGYAIDNVGVNGTWHDWINDYDIEAKDGSLTIDLADWEGRIFTI